MLCTRDSTILCRRTYARKILRLRSFYSLPRRRSFPLPRIMSVVTYECIRYSRIKRDKWSLVSRVDLFTRLSKCRLEKVRQLDRLTIYWNNAEKWFCAGWGRWQIRGNSRRLDLSESVQIKSARIIILGDARLDRYYRYIFKGCVSEVSFLSFGIEKVSNTRLSKIFPEKWFYSFSPRKIVWKKFSLEKLPRIFFSSLLSNNFPGKFFS